MDSTSRVSRLSRIAIPTRRNLYSTDNRQSTNGLRSDAMSRMSTRSTTPQRTPSMSNALATSERKKAPPTEDKRLIQSYILRITDCIKNVKDLGKDFISKGGLRSMTVRDFIIIINYIMKQIHPKANFTTHFSDELFQYLNQLDYPYSVNKSWFKTPNAPHSFNHIVFMLNFLLDYLPLDANETHDFDTVERTIKHEDFPSAQFTNQFNRKVMDGYQLWDGGQEEEFNELKLELENQLIQATFKQYKNKSELEEKTAALMAEYEELFAKRVPKPNDKGLKTLKQAVDDKKTELENLTELVQKTKESNEKVVKEIAELDKELEVYEAEHKRLKLLTQKQGKQNLQERFETMSQEKKQLSCELKSKMELLDQMNQVHYKKILHHTRIVDQKLSAQNNLLVKLIDLKENKEIREYLNLAEVDCNFVFETEQLDSLKSRLHHFNSTFLKSNQEESDQLQKEIREMKDFKIAYQNGIIQNLEEKVDELINAYKNLQSDIVTISLENDKRMSNLKDSRAQLESEIDQMKNAEERKTVELEELHLEKTSMIEETMTKIGLIKAEKEKNLNLFKVVVDNLHATIHDANVYLDSITLD